MTPELFPADRLNRECFCVGADVPALQAWLRQDLAERGYDWRIVETHPHLFSGLPVFVSRGHIERMQQVITTIESVVAMPGYQAAVLAGAPAIARTAPGPRGSFFGYDFHVDGGGASGPQLIEINTNAGGALLNVELARAQFACCDAVRNVVAAPMDVGRAESEIVAMFLQEWRLARGTAKLSCIAIVDDAPRDQFLYPEFLLFQRLFEAHGVKALVADAAELAWEGGVLTCRGRAVDLVYNRLTDFYLDDPRHHALREAYLAGGAVVTPHPYAHALYANKRNLVLLTDADRLRSIGVPEPDIATLLAGIPATRAVEPSAAEELWGGRRHLFFKPAAGFGSRGSYRGDKLTRRVFTEILTGDYVAQEIAPPGERMIRDAQAPRALKLDLRNYVYDGRVQLVAARLYQGQTTNFRTAGGGFAPVFHPPAQARSPAGSVLGPASPGGG